jgi:hypothetical protein
MRQSEAAKALAGPGGRGATTRNEAITLKLLGLASEIGRARS